MRERCDVDVSVYNSRGGLRWEEGAVGSPALEGGWEPCDDVDTLRRREPYFGEGARM